MLYNSFSFLLFFPIVATFFFLLPHKIRQGYLLVVSYFFYMNWSPTYSLFLVFVTLVSYVGAQILQKFCESDNDKLRRVVLASTLLLCFSGLFIFKYLNFLNDSLWGLFSLMGIRMEVPHLELLLPVGISFYTFQACGYMIDVYRQQIMVERNFSHMHCLSLFFRKLQLALLGEARSCCHSLR